MPIHRLVTAFSAALLLGSAAAPAAASVGPQAAILILLDRSASMANDDKWILAVQGVLPRAERVEIPNASHVMHEENAAAVNEAILGFVGRHSSEADGSS